MHESIQPEGLLHTQGIQWPQPPLSHGYLSDPHTVPVLRMSWKITAALHRQLPQRIQASHRHTNTHVIMKCLNKVCSK